MTWYHASGYSILRGGDITIAFYHFYPNRSFTAREVIESRLKDLGIPAVLGVPIGHMEDKWTMPIGVMAELDADKKSFTILETPVS